MLQDRQWGPRNVVISPNGKHLYASVKGGNIAIFDRNAADGSLSFRNTITSNLQYFWVYISPDGKHVYGLGHRQSTIKHWTRNIDSGGLSNLVTDVIDNVNLGYCKSGGNGGMCGDNGHHPYGYESIPKGLIVSPTGNNVYAVGYGSNSIVSWARESNDGRLSEKGE